MPDVEGPAKRTLSAQTPFAANPRAPYVELGVASAFSFGRGASDACDLAVAASEGGYDALGIADRNTLAGVVRHHVEMGTAKVRPLIGCRLVLTCGTELLAYPQDRAAYGRLSALLSAGKMRRPDGAWQGKDATEITKGMLRDASEGLHLVLMPGRDLDALDAGLPALVRDLPGIRYLGAAWHYRGDDRARVNRLDHLARRHELRLLATNDVLYHHPSRRPLQDVMASIREGTRVQRAGFLLEPNAERHLKGPAEMVRLFADWPHAVRATRALADRIAFSLDALRQDYPGEIVPEGATAQAHLERLTWEGAARRYPDGVPHAVRALVAKEFALIERKDLANYVLTVHDLVRFAREEARPPILCQGRGSAANSAVCFCLGITAVDPSEHEVLFERFLNEDRDEPPDIDVDFEHERREEVIQYVYRKYGRDRAGLVATVIHYRPKSALREVGKAMGLTEDVTGRMASTVWGHHEGGVGDDRVAAAGLDLADPHLRLVLRLAREMIGMPRHLSQHVGGFVLTRSPLTELVPVGNGAMPERSFVEWDKDDIDALGIFKVDVLALGMLTCIAKGFALIERHEGRSYDLATVPREDRATYDMLCEGDSLGVFQVESRAQMAMLPKLRPRTFYDLVIEVAIVRPGPIGGDMVHPYLRRRQGFERVVYPTPGPEHPQNELRLILGRTLGVPIFQEQAMKIAMVAAEFTGPEANALRKAMATFKSRGMVSAHKARMVERMVGRGYERAFAERCFGQIEGFGEYGFPESHAASFAKLVYVSSWMKRHHPAAFAAALLNSQPMGFYAPAQIVRDAAEHGVPVRPADVAVSGWDCTLEREDRAVVRGGGPGRQVAGTTGAVRQGDGGDRPRPPHGTAVTLGTGFPPLEPAPASPLALRLGLRQIDGMRADAARRIVEARARAPFTDVADLRRRARLDAGTMRRLAEADALGALAGGRRQGMWDVMGQGAPRAAPVFDAAGEDAQGPDVAAALPAMPAAEEVVADYQTARLSLRSHPMAFFRASMARQGYVAAMGLVGRGDPHVRVAGLVLIRQKPGSAKGVCFVTLEDETGVINVVIWKDVFARHRAVIMSARLMAVRGRVQTDGRVVHVVAHRIEDRSDALARLSEDRMRAVTGRGDQPTHPITGQADHLPEATAPGAGLGARGHPRDARVVPKSRDFR